MRSNTNEEQLAAIKLHADKHEVIQIDGFSTVEEYVLHLMHKSDYQVAASLANEQSVLDLGCNAGHGTHIISKVCKDITGVDVSPNAIEAAKEKYESKNVKFFVVDGLKLPFPAHSFDLVTSFQVIEHLAAYEIYFNEIKRVLRPEGILLITTPNAAIRIHPGQKPWNSFHMREFRSNELADLILRYFPFVHVLGQFAVEKTYAVEYNRCISARGSIPTQQSLGKKILRSLPQPIIDGFRGLRNQLNTKKIKVPPKNFMTMHGVEDFYYKSNDLDSSLSLVVCCSMDEITFNDATAVFLGDRQLGPDQ